ncbi:hypothetical protein, partial [Pseudomonas sp. GW704-F2]|uniref:hypothetical protein n=1 Tax=Pseudomonas sp. GW704-F2 TaxID=2070577 RepID=UPI0021145A4C
LLGGGLRRRIRLAWRGGLNLYQFAPNPIEWVDPLGLTCIKALNGGKNISKKWESKLFGKTPQQVEMSLLKKGYTKSITNFNTNKTQQTQFTRITKSGNKDVPDYHPGIVRCTEMGKSKDA